MKPSLIDGIPVYEALLSDEDCGMIRISLVDAPAVLSGWQTFAKVQRYQIQNEEQRLVRGVIMRADFPIYRNDGTEYYIIYHADTIRQMAEKYLSENRQNNVDTMHNGQDVEGVQMVQWFIKDTAKGIAPEGFDEIADGSLFAEFHITSDEIWEQVKAGTYTGFSLEGIFNAAPEENQRSIDEIVEELEGRFSKQDNQTNISDMSKVEKVLNAIRTKLEAEEQKFGRVTTDKGILEWPGEEDLKEGDSVQIVTDEGYAPAEDGDYKTEDEKVIVVSEGKVAELRDPEAEVAPQTEPEPEVEAEEEIEEEPVDFKALYEEALAKIESLEKELEAARGEVKAMAAKPAAKPAHEEVKETFHRTGNKSLDRIAELMGR